MARRFVEAGFAVRVWNRTRASAEGLGAEVAASPAEAVAGADVVVTMLADGPAVDEVMRAALPAVPAGAVWLQTSTVGVKWTDRLAAAAAERGIPYVDAPVMGSKPEAGEGSLVPLVSGPPAARERAVPVLEAISSRIMWLGDEPGLASRLKLVANHWILVTVENLAETLALARALGVDPERFLELIAGMRFDMAYAQSKARNILAREFATAFALRNARKDVGLAIEAARAAGIDLALARATHERFSRGIELGYGDADSSATFVAAVEQTER
jgi:3-hydroxyisobutyrate dehydrogenase